MAKSCVNLCIEQFTCEIIQGGGNLAEVEEAVEVLSYLNMISGHVIRVEHHDDH